MRERLWSDGPIRFMCTRPRSPARIGLGASMLLAGALAALPRAAAADPVDPAPFVRHALPEGFALPTLTDASWRFGFELALVRSGSDLMLVRGDGARVRHAPRRALPDGTWRWLATDGSGSIVEGGAGEHAVRSPDGAITRFVRGRPMETLHADGGRRRWRYDGDRLVALVDDAAGTLFLDRDAAGDAMRFELPDGTIPDAAADPSRAEVEPLAPAAESWCPADEACDAGNVPPGEAFTAGAHVPGAGTLDVRPASCRSYFVDFHGTGRGTRIGDALEVERTGPGLARTSRDFPIVDFVGADAMVSIRSRDLTSPTYANPARPALFDQLMRDGRDARRLLLDPLRADGFVAVTARAGERGVVTRMGAHPARRLVFELVVQHGVASPDQMLQIERARAELATRHGIELRVLEIP